MTSEFMMFKKVTATPTTPCDPNTIYLVSTTNPDMFKILVSDKTGTSLKDLTGDEYIKSMVVGVLNSSDSGIDWQNVPLKSNGSYVWNSISERVFGHDESNSPTFGTVKGNMKGLLFSGSVLNESWVDFTLPNDVHLDTNLYLGVHWMSLSNTIADVKIGLEYQIVKGFAQEALGTTSTCYITQSLTGNHQYKAYTSLISDNDAIDSTSIEPGALLKVRVFRDPTDSSDTLNENIHLWQLSLHYQKARQGTRNRSPNFFA